MAVTPVQAGSALQELARSLLENFDTNRDGSLSTSEFSGLVSQLATELKVAAPTTGFIPTTATSPLRSLGDDTRFEGFDLGRAQDPQKSAKDAFAMLARQTGGVPRTKTEAQQWFNDHIRDEFEKLGHKVNWVEGDKFSFTNWQGTFTVDFVRGADGPDPALAWQVDA